MNYTIHYGHGRMSESFTTLDEAMASILREYPGAEISDEWEPSAPGYEGLKVVVGPDENDVHEIRREGCEAFQHRSNAELCGTSRERQPETPDQP